ncbi:MAG TPA: class II aldolase family protein [Elusimicrobia bacterium]|nr:class II aldolase family protein [Elusimicrobiota bacterium]HBT61026.1 class II aldolase family protein [Elusimicrobiota bacterium]
MVKSDAQHRADLGHYGRLLFEKGFCPATSGNLSVRLDPWRILITPTGVSKGGMKPEDMVVISPEGRHRFGRRNASSEKDMHLQIYRLRPDVGAVVHAHPPKATSFACAGIPLDQPIASEFSMALGAVPLARYGTPGTPDVAAALEELVPRHTAILMGNHGVVSYGKDLFEAHGKMELVEHFAEIVQGTLLAGRQAELSPDELRKLNEAVVRYNAGAKQPQNPT